MYNTLAFVYLNVSHTQEIHNNNIRNCWQIRTYNTKYTAKVKSQNVKCTVIDVIANKFTCTVYKQIIIYGQIMANYKLPVYAKEMFADKLPAKNVHECTVYGPPCNFQITFTYLYAWTLKFDHLASTAKTEAHLAVSYSSTLHCSVKCMLSMTLRPLTCQLCKISVIM